MMLHPVPRQNVVLSAAMPIWIFVGGLRRLLDSARTLRGKKLASSLAKTLSAHESAGS